MDAQLLFPLPRLSGRARSARRIQRQIHVQPIRFARRFLRHFSHSHSHDLSQFLPTGKTLAIHGHSASKRSVSPTSTESVLDLEPASADFLTEAIAGLSESPRTLPCKFFYDERGSELFQKICELPEYYVTRAELQILKNQG